MIDPSYAGFAKYMESLEMPDPTPPEDAQVESVDAEVLVDGDGSAVAQISLQDFGRLIQSQRIASEKIAEVHAEHEALLFAEAMLREEHEELRKKYNRAVIAAAVVSSVGAALAFSLAWCLAR